MGIGVILADLEVVDEHPKAERGQGEHGAKGQGADLGEIFRVFDDVGVFSDLGCG